MKLKANYEQIEGVGIYVLQEIERLNEVLNEMQSLIEEVKTCWDGPDAMNFINNSSTYIKNLNNEVSFLSNLSDYMKKVAFAYGSKDVEWKNKVKKVGELDEEQFRY